MPVKDQLKRDRSPRSTQKNQKDEERNKSELFSVDTKSTTVLNINEAYTKELERCVILETVKMESVSSVSMIVEGLGFEDVEIRCLSGVCFIAFFKFEENLEGIDLDFLKVGFKKVRKVVWEDLVPTRKVWVECRGIPLIAWSEENCNVLCSNLGHIVQFSSIISNEDCYQVPAFCIETRLLGNIDQTGEVSIQGRRWSYRLVEIEYPSNFVYKDLGVGDTNCMFDTHYQPSPILQKKNCSPRNREKIWNQEEVLSKSSGLEDVSKFNFIEPTGNELQSERVVEPNDDKESDQLRSPDRSKVEESLSNNSCVNPATPRTLSPLIVDNVEDCNKWEWRSDNSSDIDTVGSRSACSQVCSLLEDSKGNDLSNRCLSQPSLLNDLKALQIKGRRGRPRKSSTRKVNNFFKVLRKRKIGKSEGLQVLDSGMIKNHWDEAKEIYETGINMGLVPVNNEEESLWMIRKQLFA